MPDLQLLHLADVHLGGSGPAFGTRVRAHQDCLAGALHRAIDLALARQVTAVCIVGDLFDTTRPAERTLQLAVRELSRLPAAPRPIACLLLPGNHDPLVPHGTYARPEWEAAGIVVWSTPGAASFRLADGALCVHASPQTDEHKRHAPLAGLAPDRAARFNVALAHGAVLDSCRNAAEPVPIGTDELAAVHMDYVALGHWHDPSDRSGGGVCAHYSGAPEIVDVGQRQPGGVLVVTLSARGTQVERVTTGALHHEDLSLEAEAHPDESAVEMAIAGHADPQLLLDVVLRGLAPEGFTCDLARLHEELASGFFRLRIRDDTVLPVTVAPESGVARSLIAERATRMLRERIARAEAAGDADGARIARRALQLALALFDGRAVLP